MQNFISKNLAYTSDTTILKLSFIVLIIATISCEKQDSNKLDSAIKNTLEDDTSIKIKKKLSLCSNQQLYNYSTTKNQKFDHQVTGKDENGEEVNGIINLEDEIGIGILKGENNNEIEIISDDINYKEIIATDINGIRYKLKVD